MDPSADVILPVSGAPEVPKSKRSSKREGLSDYSETESYSSRVTTASERQRRAELAKALADHDEKCRREREELARQQLLDRQADERKRLRAELRRAGGSDISDIASVASAGPGKRTKRSGGDDDVDLEGPEPVPQGGEPGSSAG